MKTSLYSRAFVARDVYSRWKQLVASAQANITIYSPYFDSVILSLLKANKSIEPGKINVITDFTAESILELPRQLRTIKKMISEGISVLTLSGLHAKILLIDDKYVSIGSQNFTWRGRRNKEASAVPAVPLEGTRFINTLVGWRRLAEHIDVNLVELLLSKVRYRMKQHKELYNKWRTEFDHIQENYKRAQRDAMKRHWEELEEQSPIRMARRIYATIKEIPDKNYYSLMADSGGDMTHWIIKGSRKRYELNRLSMYPVILADTLRMGFARIGKTRISYVRTGLRWSNNSLRVGDLTLQVEINFPKTKTNKRNIMVKLSDRYRGSCEFSLLFTGDSFKIINRRYIKGQRDWRDEYSEFVTTLDNDFLGSADAIENFFADFFTKFTYDTLRIYDKNIKDYLKGSWYRLEVIQYQKTPFLLITKQE